MMTTSELSHFYHIIHVFLSYGLNELIPKNRLARPLRFTCSMMFWVNNKHQEKSLAERLRLALQELGPVWIKFGQMLSTRRDLLPADIVEQLSILQDRVAPFSGAVAQAQIEKALGGPIECWFDDFELTPLASASIAQVHTATLKKNNKHIVIKVIRPDILPLIHADMKLMHRLAGWLPKLFPDGRRLRPQEVVRDYRNTLINELNLLREAANAIQIRRNFIDSEMIYIPEVYTDFCRENVLVMERIHGITVSNISELNDAGINMKLLAERGVKIFFTQVFRDNFFHADMHPGNIFVSYQHPQDPQYIAIDYGIVGSLNKADKRYLAENFLAFFNRDYRRVAELHIDSGWVSADTNVEEFEFAIRTLCEPIFEKPLADISFGHVLLNLFNTARRFNMEIQPQLVLLQKTLLYIEGLGRQLYPQLDLWTTAKPFLETWLKEQIGFIATLRALKEKSPFLSEKLPELPELIYNHLIQSQKWYSQTEASHRKLQLQSNHHHRSLYLFGIGAILALSSTLLFIHKAPIYSIGLASAASIIWLVGWKQSQ